MKKAASCFSLVLFCFSLYKITSFPFFRLSFSFFSNKRLKTMPVTILPFIQQEMIRYGMTIYFALGLVGNILNCIMFMGPLYRRTSSSIYFLSLSMIAIIYLIWSVVPLIYTLDHIDPQTQSLFYCKVRLYSTHVLVNVSAILSYLLLLIDSLLHERMFVFVH